MAKKQSTTFEQSLKRLEEIVDQMERGDMTLDDSLALFQEGVELARACTQRLGEAEARIQQLARIEEGKFILEPLNERSRQDGESPSQNALLSESDNEEKGK